MCLLYIFVWALQFWQSSSQGSSQKVKKGYHHEITALFACLSLFCLAPPRCLTLLPEALDWDCTYPWAHSSLGWILSLLSAASDVYYIALYKHICIYAPCGSRARICDGALNTNANLCTCVYVQVSWCVLICNAVACRATLLPSPFLSLSFLLHVRLLWCWHSLAGFVGFILMRLYLVQYATLYWRHMYVCTRVCVCVCWPLY